MINKVDGFRRSQPCADANALALAIREILDETEGFDEPQRSELVAASAMWPVLALKAAMREACDLLAERRHGNPARSAGHNARLCLESALAGHPTDATIRSQAEEIAALTARAASLEGGLRSAADELESELRNRYEGVLDHPAMKSRFERDMVSVNEARALLTPTQTKD